MPIASARSQLGAIVTVEVGPSIVATGRGAPSAPGAQPQRIDMLLDTGSEQSVLDEELVSSWGLVYTSAGWARTIIGTKPARSYEVMLTLGERDEEGLRIDPLTVMARPSPFPGARYSGLLGRDVLDRCYLIYDGPGYRFSLNF